MLFFAEKVFEKMQPNAFVRGIISEEPKPLETRMQTEMTTPVNHDLDSLFVTYGDMIYRLALVRTRSAADAEDVVQEVFLRCLKSSPVFENAEHQKAWLLQVDPGKRVSATFRAAGRGGRTFCRRGRIRFHGL